VKKIRVRESKIRDLGLFRSLWKKYLNDPENSDVLVTPDKQAEEVFEGLFKVYTASEAEGIVLFVGEVGVLMAGTLNTNVNYRTGNTAHIWGAFVREDARGRGIAKELFKVAKEKLKELGFESVTLALPSNNLRTTVAAKGFKPFMVHHYMPLEEEEHELDKVVEPTGESESREVDEGASESAPASNPNE
jgi:ribosomal protein S18 acetylase RimI-like enzyme